jgi:hypothetical protein
MPTPNPLCARRMVYRKIGVIALGVCVLAAYLRAHDPFSEALLNQAFMALLPQGDSPVAALLHRDVVQRATLFVAGALVYLAGVWIYARLVVDPAWSAWERSVQRRREPSAGSTSLLVAFLRDVNHRVSPYLWFVLCSAAIALPASIFAQVASHWGVGNTREEFLRVLEGGREVLGLLLLALCSALIGAVAYEASERFSSRHG